MWTCSKGIKYIRHLTGDIFALEQFPSVSLHQTGLKNSPSYYFNPVIPFFLTINIYTMTLKKNPMQPSTTDLHVLPTSCIRDEFLPRYAFQVVSTLALLTKFPYTWPLGWSSNLFTIYFHGHLSDLKVMVMISWRFPSKTTKYSFLPHYYWS